MTDQVGTGGLTRSKKAVVADIILNMIALNSFGVNMDHITHMIRQQEEEGAKPKEILQWLRDTVNTEAKSLRERLSSQVVAG